MAGRGEVGFRFQFSLRTFLIATCTLGVGGGLLGRLFLRNPDAFLVVISVLSSIVPFLLAICTIYWIATGRKSVSLVPVCGKCGHDLRSADPDDMTRCTQCEADLTEPGGLSFTRVGGRRWGLAIWATMLLLMPVVGGVTMVVAQSFYGPGPGGMGILSNQEVIEKRLPKQIGEPWVWQELENRLAAGSLSKKEVDKAVKKLIAHMTAKRPQGWNQPLHWSNKFLTPAIQAGMVSDKVLFELCDAFHGTKPVIRPLMRLREGQGGFNIEVEYGNHWGTHSDLGVALVWEIGQVLLDGKPVQVRQNHKHGQDWSGNYQGNLMTGDHELTVEVQCAYIDKSKLIGLNADSLPKNRWPKARKQWKTSVTAPLKVLPVGKQVLSLVTDTKRDPGPNGGLRIDRFVVQTDSGGKKKIILKTEFATGLPIPLSYDLSAVVGDQTIPLGSIWVVERENGRASSRGQVEGRIASVAPAIRSADIILTPNPAHIEQRPEVSEIWGKEVILYRVPLERLDLEVGQEEPVGPRN
jgi:hypothetical protein